MMHTCAQTLRRFTIRIRWILVYSEVTVNELVLRDFFVGAAIRWMQKVF